MTTSDHTQPMHSDDIEAALLALNDETGEWTISGKTLENRYEFRDFVTAFGFMTQVALVAERMNHHPEWSNVYKTVDIHLTTHEVGTITGLDFEFAREVSAIAARFTD